MTRQALKRTSTGKQSQRWRCIYLNNKAAHVCYVFFDQNDTENHLVVPFRGQNSTKKKEMTKKIHIHMTNNTSLRCLQQSTAAFGGATQLLACLDPSKCLSKWALAVLATLSFRIRLGVFQLQGAEIQARAPFQPVHPMWASPSLTD